MKLHPILCVGYTTANAGTVLYLGDSMTAANAALLAVHDGGTYTRAVIYDNLAQSLPKHKYKLPATGGTLAAISR